MSSVCFCGTALYNLTQLLFLLPRALLFVMNKFAFLLRVFSR